MWRTCYPSGIVWCRGLFCVSPSVDHNRYQFSEVVYRKSGSFDERRARHRFCCRSSALKSVLHFRGATSVRRENGTDMATFYSLSHRSKKKQKQRHLGWTDVRCILLNSIDSPCRCRCTLAHARRIHVHGSVISAIHFLSFLIVAIDEQLSLLPPPPFLLIASAGDSPPGALWPECNPRHPIAIAIAEHNPISITKRTVASTVLAVARIPRCLPFFFFEQDMPPAV